MKTLNPLKGKDLHRANRELCTKLKLALGCSECGYNSHAEALQWDHIDPNTKFRTKNGTLVNPGNMIMYAQSVMLAEFKKCRVLCANCHAVHTKQQQDEIRKLNKQLQLA